MTHPVIHPFIHPPLHPSTAFPSITSRLIHPPTCPSIHLPIRLFVHSSTYPSNLHTSSSLSIHLSICSSIYLSDHSSIHPPVCPFVHPSILLSTCLSPLPSITCSLCAVCWLRPHLLTLPPPHLSRKLLLWSGSGSRRLVHLLCSSTSPLLHPLHLGTDP